MGRILHSDGSRLGIVLIEFCLGDCIHMYVFHDKLCSHINVVLSAEGPKADLA